jgi:hypothetical protein
MPGSNETDLNVKITGGDGVAEYGVKVFGGPGEQHAVEGSNVIAMNVVKGGKGKKTRKNKGGSVLSDIAVPMTLLYANHAYSAKKSKKSFKPKKSLKNRRSSYRKYRK